MSQPILPGKYLREYAQMTSDAPVRVEVIEVTPSGAQAALPVAPIADTAIGDGSGAWTSADLLAAVRTAVNDQAVDFWPQPVVEAPAEVVPEGTGVTEGIIP